MEDRIRELERELLELKQRQQVERLNEQEEPTREPVEKLTAEQIARYGRQLIMENVRVKGQKKLLNSRVLIVGTGGLGAPVSKISLFFQTERSLRQ